MLYGRKSSASDLFNEKQKSVDDAMKTLKTTPTSTNHLCLLSFMDYMGSFAKNVQICFQYADFGLACRPKLAMCRLPF